MLSLTEAVEFTLHLTSEERVRETVCECVEGGGKVSEREREGEREIERERYVLTHTHYFSLILAVQTIW